MNAGYGEGTEAERLALLREQGAITDHDYELARSTAARGASRRFRMEVERLVSQRARGAIDDHQYKEARRRCAMRLEGATDEKEQQLRRKTKLDLSVGRIGFVLACIATAAATCILILDRLDPYADNVPLGVGVGLILTSIVLGPVALSLLLSAPTRWARSSEPVARKDRTLVGIGLAVAGVGTVEMFYLFANNLGGTL